MLAQDSFHLDPSHMSNNDMLAQDSFHLEDPHMSITTKSNSDMLAQDSFHLDDSQTSTLTNNNDYNLPNNNLKNSSPSFSNILLPFLKAIILPPILIMEL